MSELTEQRPKSVGLKVIAISCAGLLLSMGLCGLGFMADRSVHDGAPGTLDIFGFAGLLLSLFTLLVGVVIAALELVQRRRQTK